MKITVIGSGYVGLVTGACLADVGNDVLCVDVDQTKIDALLRGEIPIFEPGLDKIILRNVEKGRLRFTTDSLAGALHGRLQIIAVGTPPGEGGEADLRYVRAAANFIGLYRKEYCVVVDKSTVPVGTGDEVEGIIHLAQAKSGNRFEFSVVSNPEFLKEGAAIEDFTKPDRIVVGVNDDPRAEEIMREVYAPFQRNHDKVIVMSRRSAELTKYAANAMLATRISFMNEMAALAEATGADIEDIRRGIGSDPRIGFSFLYAGTGYGGSCFPKDVSAAIQSGAKFDVSMDILKAVEQTNRVQKTVLFRKAQQRLGSLKGKTFGLWGLAFKPNTDDLREAPSLELANSLLEAGAFIKAYDPVAAIHLKDYFPGHPNFSLVGSASEAADGSDALFIVTEWTEFRSFDLDLLKTKLKQPIVFDGRNLYAPTKALNVGLEYFAIGRGANVRHTDAVV